MLLKLTSNSGSPPQFPSSWNYRHAPPCLFCLYKSAPLKWHMGMEPGSICPSWLAYSPGDTGSSVFFPFVAHPRMPSLLAVSNIPLSKCACHTLLTHSSTDGLCGGNENNCKKVFPCICFESLGPILGSEIGMCCVNLSKLYLCTAKFIIAPKILDKIL